MISNHFKHLTFFMTEVDDLEATKHAILAIDLALFLSPAKNL